MSEAAETEWVYNRPKHGWTCYHCGETFKTPGAAADHFGASPDSVPGCILKVQFGGERGMLMTMRRLEDILDKIKFALNDENWDITKGPDDAISSAWDKVHEGLDILQQWKKSP